MSLPWKMISFNKETKNFKDILKQSIIEITHQKIDKNIFYLKTDDLIYWPSNIKSSNNLVMNEIDIFSCLNMDYWE